jgi:uncharacterized protein YoxC
MTEDGSEVPSDLPSDAPAAKDRELDEFLARAVDRQIAEQRALREALTELTDAVRDLQSRPAPDVEGSEVLGELRDMRDSITTRLERAVEGAQDVQAVGQEVAILRESLGGVAADIEGLAQSLIDLNSGLREWADSVERNVDEVRNAVGLVGANGEAEDAAEALYAEDEQPLVEEQLAIVPFQSKVDQIEERVKETVELSLYLADQIEDFDRVISRMGDLPTKLEGVITQAVKRTLAARAKLDRDAEVVLDDVLDALDEQVEGMSTGVAQLSQSADAVRGLTVGQNELASRIDALHAELGALADAIDRAAEGRAPRAAASVEAATRRRSKPQAKRAPKPIKSKPIKTSAKASARKASSSKARRKPSKRLTPESPPDEPTAE